LSEFKINRGKYDRIIKNACEGVYSGFIVYCRKHKDSKGKVIRKEEIKYKGEFDSIIEESLWRKVDKNG